MEKRGAVYHKDWTGEEYKDKADVIQGIMEYFYEDGSVTADKIMEHFTAIFKELDDSVVKQIMDVQDKLFCAMD